MGARAVGFGLGMAVLGAGALYAWLPWATVSAAESAIRQQDAAGLASLMDADRVSASVAAQAQAALLVAAGMDKLPVCFAKTQYSFSHDAELKGAPEGFTLPIRDLRLSAGAQFIVVLVGAMPLIPGLPTRPVFFDIYIHFEGDNDGRIIGLS